MRLLYLNHNYRHDGTYYRAFPMAERLARRGHQVTLITVSRDQRWRAMESEINGVRIIETPNWGQDCSGNGYGPLDNGLRLIHALANRYDIVHMFDHKPNASFAGFPGRLRGARLVSDWVDWWGGPGGINDVAKRRLPAIGRFEVWWEERSKRWADGVLTISTVLRERAIALGCAPERTLYLPTGAPTERIRPVPLATARRELGIPLERRMAGFIGWGQSDLELVMAAMQQLPDLWLMVVGRPSERLNETARAFGVTGRLWQTGFVPDERVSVYLGCADCMVLPLADSAANRGRLPNKLLDYMAAGRPTVANPVGDVKTIMEEHRIGLLVGRDEFGRGLHRLFTEPVLRDELGNNARHVAETVFDWEHLIDRLEAFYEIILGG